MRYFLFLGVWLAVGIVASAEVHHRMTNDDVIELVRAGFTESVVMQAVQRGDSAFDVSTGALDALRSAGVEEAVIAAMKTGSEPPQHLDLLDPGVYFKRDNVYALVMAEPVTWDGSSSAVDAGGAALTRVALTGRVDNRTSRLVLHRDEELLIVCEPGRSASEYQLLRADVKSQSREFRAQAALRGTDLLGLGDAGKNIAPVEIDNTFDLGVRVLLGSLRRGEYGLVPPGVIADGRVVPEGPIYTFTLK